MSSLYPARKILYCILIAAVGLPPVLSQTKAPEFTISTIAGNGTVGFAGDSGQATVAQLNYPWGIAVDSSGNFYIADQLNSRIRKVATDGTINTSAGTGTFGFTGDGGTATSAQIKYPTGLALASGGNLYFADTSNHRIRMVSSAGAMSTVAGNGNGAFYGDTNDAKDASLNSPSGVAVDSAGNIYIADTLNHCIRKVGTDGKISTVAGTGGSAGYSGDGAAATSAKLNQPMHVIATAAGELYIADTMNHAIRKVNKDGNISTVAGNGTPGFAGDNGPATSARLFYPRSGVRDADGNLYIADYLNNRIRVVTASGTIYTVAGSGQIGFAGDDGPATRARMKFPLSIAAGSAGKLYVSDTHNGVIRLLTPVVRPDSGGEDPVISEGGVFGASDFGGPSLITPGSLIEIHGSNLASGSFDLPEGESVTGDGPTALDGTRVTIGGQAASLLSISPNRIKARLPVTLEPGSYEVTVTTAVGTSAPATILVSPAS